MDLFVTIVHVDGGRLHLLTAATNGPDVHSQMIHKYGEPWWNDVDRGKLKNLEKTCPSATLSNTNTTRTDQGANPQ
jgi:hypothetical protein